MYKQIGKLVFKVLLYTFAAIGVIVVLLTGVNNVNAKEKVPSPKEQGLNVGLSDQPTMCGDPNDMVKVINEGGSGAGVERKVASLEVDKSIHIDLNIWYNLKDHLLTMEVVQFQDGKAIKSCAPFQGPLNPAYLKTIMPEWQGLQIPKGADPGQKYE